MHGRSHAVLVILADVNHRQVPELRHVPGLVDLALRRRAVAVQREGHGARAVVLVGEGDTGTDRHLCNNHDAGRELMAGRIIKSERGKAGNNTKSRRPHLSPDDTVAAVKSLPVHVHRAALALCRAGFTSHHFREHRASRGSEQDGERVTSVRCDQSVVLGQRQFYTDGHGFLDHATIYIYVSCALVFFFSPRWRDIHGSRYVFESREISSIAHPYLTGVQVQETVDETLPVQFRGSVLHPTHVIHRLQDVLGLVRCQRRFFRWSLVESIQVVFLREKTSVREKNNTMRKKICIEDARVSYRFYDSLFAGTATICE